MRTATVLISSAGRRVELLRGFRRALAALGVRGRVLAADCSWYSSAFHEADDATLVPRCTTTDFVPAMLDLCREQHVNLLVPTIDTELAVLAAHHTSFTAVGTTLSLSAPDVVAIAFDKVRTHDWLVANGFPTVAQALPSVVLAEPAVWPLPFVVKPRSGSSGKGVAIVHSDDELAAVVRRSDPNDLIVQELAQGLEHTVDVLVDWSGTGRCAVPRRRLEVRSGEVSKAVTVRSPELSELAVRIAETLPGAFGALNVQIFQDDATGDLAVIEINPRYGGGFPLSLHAGADFPRWQLEELLGFPSTISPHAWRDGIVMLRYDAAIFADMREAPCQP